MGEFVQRSLEELAPVFEQLQHAQLFDATEIKALVKKCKAHEYRLAKREKRKTDFVTYAQYLIHLLALIRRRRERLGYWFKSNEIDFAVARKIDAIFRTACIRFQSDVRLWLSRIAFAKKRKATTSVSKMYLRMLQVHGTNTSIWLAAAKWEVEELGSVENARALIQRALRFMPESQKLWLELFRLELLYVDKIRKRRRVLLGSDAQRSEDSVAGEADAVASKASTSSEDGVQRVEDSLLDCGLARLAFSHALRSPAARGDTASFCTHFVPIANLFLPFSSSLLSAIYDHLSANFSESEDAWNALALRAVEPADGQTMELEARTCAVFDEAVAKIDTEKMWAFYIEFCLGHHRGSVAAGNVKTIKRTAKLLVSVLHRAVSTPKHHALAEKYSLLLTELVGDVSAQRDILEKAIERRRLNSLTSPSLWTELLRVVIAEAVETGDKPARKRVEHLLNSAVESLPEKDSLAVWQMAMAWSALRGRRALERRIETALSECSSTLLAELKEFLLAMLFRDAPSSVGEEDSDERLLRRLCDSKPNSIEFYLKVVKALLSTSEARQRRLVECVFEAAVSDYGRQSVDLWLEFAKFKASVGDTAEIYRRAVRELDGSRVQEFTEKFALMKATSGAR